MIIVTACCKVYTLLNGSIAGIVIFKPRLPHGCLSVFLYCVVLRRSLDDRRIPVQRNVRKGVRSFSNKLEQARGPTPQKLKKNVKNTIKNATHN